MILAGSDTEGAAMITFVRGDLFQSPARVLVNTVNTVGVMGKGIALTFKTIYPEMFERYRALCESKQLDVGKLWLYKTNHKWILNFPTKKHWRNPSKLEYIEAGLQKFVTSCAEQRITSIAFPELGCGNGELAWDEVRPLMVRYLKPLPINTYIYEYDRPPVMKPEHRDIEGTRAWLRSEPRSLAFAEVWSDIQELVNSEINLVSATGEKFTVKRVQYEQEGLVLHVNVKHWHQTARDYLREQANRLTGKWRYASDRTIYVPEDSIRELWQNIRFYGFFHRHMTPGGLDLIAEYLYPLLARLPYLKEVTIASGPSSSEPVFERALQLYIDEALPRQEETELQLVSA
jgi:O-acetyl-ADP-ribose deacetylase (regulator of RNase III)